MSRSRVCQSKNENFPGKHDSHGLNLSQSQINVIFETLPAELYKCDGTPMLL